MSSPGPGSGRREASTPFAAPVRKEESMIEEKYRFAAEYMVTTTDIVQRTGLTVVAMRDRYAKLMMPLGPNTNHVGMMYAGSLYCLGEVSGAAIFVVAFDPAKYVPIVKEASIRYLAPALTDVTVEMSITREKVASMELELREGGKSDLVMDLELKDSGGNVVSLFRGTWQFRTMSPGFELLRKPG
jgi:thioesterase domain-containing protein